MAPEWFPNGFGATAVRVALAIGAHKSVLCGIPLEADGAHFHVAGAWTEAEKYRRAWTQCLPEIKDSVRSPSGWTRGLLGAPTVDWLGAQMGVSGRC